MQGEAQNNYHSHPAGQSRSLTTVAEPKSCNVNFWGKADQRAYSDFFKPSNKEPIRPIALWPGSQSSLGSCQATPRFQRNLSYHSISLQKVVDDSLVLFLLNR